MTEPWYTRAFIQKDGDDFSPPDGVWRIGPAPDQPATKTDDATALSTNSLGQPQTERNGNGWGTVSFPVDADIGVWRLSGGPPLDNSGNTDLRSMSRVKGTIPFDTSVVTAGRSGLWVVSVSIRLKKAATSHGQLYTNWGGVGVVETGNRTASASNLIYVDSSSTTFSWGYTALGEIDESTFIVARLSSLVF